MKYRKSNISKRYDSSCRNHGSCDYCKRSRLYQAEKAKAQIISKLKEYMEDKNVEKN